MRKKIDPSNCSRIELLYALSGSIRRAGQVGAFISAWGVARDALGHDPTMEEYAEYWRIGPATAYREQARFRELFPDLDSPAAILDLEAGATAGRDYRGVTA